MKATAKALAFLLLILFSFGLASAQWWDSNWKNRVQVNITNNEDDAVWNMSINVTLNTAGLISLGKMKSDCSDIRVVFNNNLVDDVGIQFCNSSNTFIYFKYNFTAKETKTFYIYFGNPNASSVFVDFKRAYYALYEDFDTGSTSLFDSYRYVTNGGWTIAYDSSYGYVLKRYFSGDCGDTFCKGSFVSKQKVASRNARITFNKFVVGNCGDYSGFGFTTVNGNYNYEVQPSTSYLDMGNGATNYARITNVTTSYSSILTNIVVPSGYALYSFTRNKTHGLGCINNACSQGYYFPNYPNFANELHVVLWHSQSPSCAGFVDNIRVENVGILGYSYSIGMLEPSEPMKIRLVNITVNALEPVTDGEVFVNVTMNFTDVYPNFANIRVYDSSMRELYFVIENSGNGNLFNNIVSDGTVYYVPIWFRANLTTGLNIFYIVYGNSSWTSFSDKGGFIWNRTAARNVFYLFDNFDNHDTSLWNIMKTGTANWCYYSFVGGYFYVKCSHNQNVWLKTLQKHTNSNMKMVYETNLRVYTPYDYKDEWGYLSFQMRNETKPGGAQSWATYDFWLFNRGQGPGYSSSTCYDHYTYCINSGFRPYSFSGRWNRVTIYGYRYLAAFYLNGVNYWNQTNPSYNPDPSLTLWTGFSFAYYNTTHNMEVESWIDWVIVRKWLNYTYSYTITEIVSQINLTILPSTSVVYGTPVNVTCLTTPFTRNGTSVISENSTFVVLPAGAWNYTCGSESQIVTVSKASGNVTFAVSPPSPITYGSSATTANCYSNHAQAPLYLLRNGTNVGNETLVLPAGAWNYTCYIPESQNYTGSSSSIMYIVNKRTTNLVMSLLPSSPITYGTATTATCYEDSEAPISFTRNGTSVGNHTLVLPAGAWNYTCSVPETQNYTAASSSSIYIVNRATPSITFSINPSSPITYGTTTSVSCSGTNPETSVIIYRNGTSVGNHSLILAAGYYNYTCFSSMTQNYTAVSQEIGYTVNRAVNTANLFINGTQNQNYYLKWPNGIYAYGTCSNINNIQPQLYRNGTLISGASETTQLPVGNWTYNVTCLGNQNYTADSKSYWVFASRLPQIMVGLPNMTSYYFFPNETKLIPIAFNSTGILPVNCYYSVGNVSFVAECMNHYSFVNFTTSYQRTYVSGHSNCYTTSFFPIQSQGIICEALINFSLATIPRNCSYEFYYLLPSSPPFEVAIHHFNLSYWTPYYKGSGNGYIPDSQCFYANKNALWRANIPYFYNSGYNMYLYPTRMYYNQEFIYSFVPNRVGNYILGVNSTENFTLNTNQTFLIFFVDFTNIFNVRNNKGQHLPAKIVFSNSTYNYTVQGTSPLYVNTSMLPYGFVTAYIESPNYIPQTQYYTFNASTSIESNITMINSGVFIKVLHEQSRAPINWYKLAITNSSDRNEVNFDTMKSGSYTNYLTVGKGYPSTPFQEFLDDNLNTYKDNPNANFTYNFGFTNATFEVWYESSSGGTLQIRAWNNVLGKWDDITTITTGSTGRTMRTFNINNRPVPEANITTGYYGDLYQNCEGYYCPLFEVKTTSGNIRLYEIRLVYPYSYDINGYLSMNFTDFGMATGRSRITASSPLFSGANFYGERTYYVNPTTDVITNLNIYLYPNCLIQQFYTLETIPFSETPRAIKNALLTIYKEFEGTIYPVDQEISSELGSAYLCVDPTNSYIFTVTHEDYKPFYSYSISFSNPNQPINIFMEVLPKESMTFPWIYFDVKCRWSDNANTYSENETYQMFGKYCPERLPENATSFMYACFVDTYNKKADINYGGLYVYRKSFSNYGSNFTLPVWNESSLPYNMNETQKYELIYNVTSSSVPLIFNYLALDEGDYIFICYVNYDWYLLRNYTSFYTKRETRIMFDKKETLAPAGKGLISGISKDGLWLIGLILTMMVTGFFGYRFGVNSLLIFFLMWSMILTIFGGWGLNFPTGVLILAILIWIALTFGRW